MAILITNPVKITVQLLDQKPLTSEQIFKLAHNIDAYEIEKQLQDSLAIDINKVTKTGYIELVITPTSGLTYDELSEHFNLAMVHSLENVNLPQCRWEIIEIAIKTATPGRPSYVDKQEARHIK